MEPHLMIPTHGLYELCVFKIKTGWHYTLDFNLTEYVFPHIIFIFILGFLMCVNDLAVFKQRIKHFLTHPLRDILNQMWD